MIGERAERFARVRGDGCRGPQSEIEKPYKLGAGSSKRKNTVIDIDGVRIGGARLSFMAGPVRG